MRGQDKRARIMQAAETLFSSRRFHEITTDDIARSAQVGKGTIYRYFKDKDDLFFQTATSGFEQLCQLLERVASTEDSFEGQLLAACQQIRAFFERRRRLFRMMQAEDNRLLWTKGKVRERWLEKRQELVTVMAEVLANGAAEGKIRQDLPSDMLANFLLGMLRTQFRDMGERDDHRGCDVVVDLFMNGSTEPRSNHAHTDTARGVAETTIDHRAVTESA